MAMLSYTTFRRHAIDVLIIHIVYIVYILEINGIVKSVVIIAIHVITKTNKKMQFKSTSYKLFRDDQTHSQAQSCEGTPVFN